MAFLANGAFHVATCLKLLLHVTIQPPALAQDTRASKEMLVGNDPPPTRYLRYAKAEETKERTGMSTARISQCVVLAEMV